MGFRAEPAKRRPTAAPLVWVVKWVDAEARGVGMCPHRHANADDATMCPWEPALVPPVGAGLVVQIRDPEYRPLGQVIREARQPREQLRMPWAARAT